MTEQQKQHSQKLADRAFKRMVYKYEKGAQEHQSNLWEYTPTELLSMALEEVDDLMHFLLTLQDALKEYRPSDLDENSND
jgi:hypothetical protein